MQEEPDRHFRKPLPYQPRHQHELVVVHPQQVVRPQHLQHRLRKDAVYLLVLLPILLLINASGLENSGTAAIASCCRTHDKSGPLLSSGRKTGTALNSFSAYAFTAASSSGATVAPGQPSQRNSGRSSEPAAPRFQVAPQPRGQSPGTHLEVRLAVLLHHGERQPVGHNN